MNEVVAPAAHAPAAAGEAKVDHEARAKRLAAVRARRNANRWKPFTFVLLSLLAWWVLATAADIVTTCVPGGAPCRVPWRSSPATGFTWHDWVLLMLSLVAALWVAKAAVYPAADGADEFSEDELDGNA